MFQNTRAGRSPGLKLRVSSASHKPFSLDQPRSPPPHPCVNPPSDLFWMIRTPLPPSFSLAGVLGCVNSLASRLNLTPVASDQRPVFRHKSGVSAGEKQTNTCYPTVGTVLKPHTQWHLVHSTGSNRSGRTPWSTRQLRRQFTCKVSLYGGSPEKTCGPHLNRAIPFFFPCVYREHVRVCDHSSTKLFTLKIYIHAFLLDYYWSPQRSNHSKPDLSSKKKKPRILIRERKKEEEKKAGEL